MRFNSATALSAVRAAGPPALAVWLLLIVFISALAQGSGHTLFGDVKIDESKTEGLRPLTLDILLYNLAGQVVARQRVANNDRYRFLGLRGGEYDLVVEVENVEIARIRVSLGGGSATDFRHDLEFEWKSDRNANVVRKKQTVSAADFYQRKTSNQTLFEKAQAAVNNKKYDGAVDLFRQLLDLDPQDFQAWIELGTAFLLQEKLGEAEKAYVQAIKVRPDFVLALLNLGRVRSIQKNFDGAIEPLSHAVELDSQSAEANFLLGEAYLRIKKGSKAVGYLNEAARLGRPEAHLRLAALYDAAGLKDRAAAEYEQFLKKRPDYSERQKLEKYIARNKKP